MCIVQSECKDCNLCALRNEFWVETLECIENTNQKRAHLLDSEVCFHKIYGVLPNYINPNIELFNYSTREMSEFHIAFWSYVCTPNAIICDIYFFVTSWKKRYPRGKQQLAKIVKKSTKNKNELFYSGDNAEEKFDFRCELVFKIHLLVSRSNKKLLVAAISICFVCFHWRCLSACVCWNSTEKRHRISSEHRKKCREKNNFWACGRMQCN